MQNALSRDCPVCEGADSTPYWQKGDLRVVRCAACRMMYANPVPVGLASGAFYDAAGRDYYLSPAKLESDYSPVRFARELRLFRRFCPRGAVLDVGCSSGAFLFQVKQRWPNDYEVLGSDVSGAPLDYAESRGVPVLRGDFLSHELAAGMFDAITFWAVIEHLAEPARFLDRASVLLKPGGHCFVLVPNLKSLAVRLLGARYRYVYPQHLNYFTSQTLRRLCAPRFAILAKRYTHFNPVVIWQDWRSGGREIENTERAALLKRTTALKQKPWLAPLKWGYTVAEKALASLGIADNLVLILRRN